MLQGVDLTQIKQYNTTLKQYRDKAANLNAQIDYTSKELDTLCAELSAELGTTVTRDNIEQIYNEQVEKINSTLQSGNAVLNKVISEEQLMTQAQPQSQVSVQPQPAMTQPAMAQPTMAQPVGVNPVASNVVNSSQVSWNNATIQPMFHLN